MSHRFQQYPQKKYLMNGEAILARNPTLIWMDLGSCISVIFYSDRLKLSALTHSQLPENRRSKGSCRESCPTPCYLQHQEDNNLNYVNCAIKFLIHQFRKMQVAPSETTVKVIGGSDIFSLKVGDRTVAECNIELAKAWLKREGYKINFEDTGGSISRKIYHCSDTGETEIVKNTTSIYNTDGTKK